MKKLSAYLFYFFCSLIPLQGQMVQQRLPESSGIDNHRRTSFNMEEIKVRWKKSSLENCPGVPCVTTPAFTCGTSTISDIDGNSYNTLSFGTQCWTKENLTVSRYNDGTMIPLDNSGGSDGQTGGQNWSSRIAGAYAIYANEASTGTNAKTYGFLYNGYAVTDIRKICPAGWHVPSDTEWTSLIQFMDPTASGSALNIQSATAGGMMKSTGTSLWDSPNTGANNLSEFSVLPGGYRNRLSGAFSNIGARAYFWSATESEINNVNAWHRELNFNSSNVNRSLNSKSFGASVRCLKD